MLLWYFKVHFLFCAPWREVKVCQNPYITRYTLEKQNWQPPFKGCTIYLDIHSTFRWCGPFVKWPNLLWLHCSYSYLCDSTETSITSGFPINHWLSLPLKQRSPIHCQTQIDCETLVMPQRAEAPSSSMKKKFHSWLWYMWQKVLLPGCLPFAKRRLAEGFLWCHRGMSRCDPELWSGPVAAPPSEGALQHKRKEKNSYQGTKEMTRCVSLSVGVRWVGLIQWECATSGTECIKPWQATSDDSNS